MHTFFFYFKVLGEFSCIFSYCALILMWRHLDCTLFYLFFQFLFCTFNIAAIYLSVALVALVALCHHVMQMSFPSSEGKIHVFGIKVYVLYLVFFAMSVRPNCVMHSQRDLVVCGEELFHKMLVMKWQCKRVIRLPFNESENKQTKKTTLQCREHKEMDFQSTKHWYNKEMIRIFSHHYPWTFTYEQHHQTNKRLQ